LYLWPLVGLLQQSQVGQLFTPMGWFRPKNQYQILFLLVLSLDDPDAVVGALERAERFYFKESANLEKYSPIVLVIHGSEVCIFYKENYDIYKAVVDLAARLSAFNVVDIRVCETSAKGLGLDLDTLFPFVDTVTYGPAEVVRLIEVEKYRYF